MEDVDPSSDWRIGAEPGAVWTMNPGIRKST